jgi:hypothetical protein
MHSFGKYCIDPDSLVKAETLKGFLTALKRQSGKDEALIPYHDQIPLDDDGVVIRAPGYYGAGGEFLAETFFDVWGLAYNLAGITSTDDLERHTTDGGVDHLARSVTIKIYREHLDTKAQPGSPVYIQTKTTNNATRVYTTNDGSRIMNFFGHAQALARSQGTSLSARYIVFTTGKGLGWQLERNTLGLIQVVAHNEIRRRVDSNRIFWNRMRERFGLPAVDLPAPPLDPEYRAIQAEIAALAGLDS